VSLRSRLTGVFAVAMAVMLTGLGAFIYLRMGAELLRGVDRSLGSRADTLTAALAADPGTALAGGRQFADPDEAFAQVLDRTGRVLAATPGATSPLLTPGRAARVAGPTLVTRPHPGQDDPDRLLVVPASSGGRPVLAVVGETLGDRHDALHHLLIAYVVVGPAGLLLTSAAGWALAGAALRPVETIRRRATQLSHSDPRGRLPVPGTGDELARLACTLNDLLARLHAAVEREHRFVDDASHELRTPLAILKAELDLAASRPREAAELGAVLAVAAGQTDRLAALADDLLVLARSRQGPVRRVRALTHLPTLLTEAVAPLRADSAGRTITVRAPDVVVAVDPGQLGRAVRNLVENAICHGDGAISVEARVCAAGDATGDAAGALAGPVTGAQPVAGGLRIDVRDVPGGLRIDVRDHGPGFPPGLLPVVFQPFVRGSPTEPGPPERGRPRDDQPGGRRPPGSGLGLAIVRAVVEGHGGTVIASNGPDGGAQVRVHLPGPASDPPALNPR
jgi:signal transduction histidine kinase